MPNSQFYDLADDFNAQFIVNCVAQTRKAFTARLELLRAQLLDAALTPEQINATMQKQAFSLESLAGDGVIGITL